MTRGVLKAKKAKETKARKEKEKTKLGKLNKKIKELQESIKTREATKLGGAFKAQTDKKKKQLETLKLQKKTLTSPLPKSTGRDFETSKTNQPSTKNVRGGDFDKPLKSQSVKKPVEKSSSNKQSGSVKPINTNSRKKDKGIGEKIVNELKGETRRQQSQLNKPKGRAESVKEQLLIQGKREYDTPLGKITVDSTDEGMDTDRANFRSGGSTLKKRYGAREGGFTKRGGMYKKGY